jgi:hypothetical protein
MRAIVIRYNLCTSKAEGDAAGEHNVRIRES